MGASLFSDVEPWSPQEGRNAERFKRLYGDRVDVKVPGIYWDMTAARVLTMVRRRGLSLLALGEQSSSLPSGSDEMEVSRTSCSRPLE